MSIDEQADARLYENCRRDYERQKRRAEFAPKSESSITTYAGQTPTTQPSEEKENE